MAYTFDRINSLFNRPQESNTNVIGGKKPGAYGELKSDTGGDVSGSNAGGSTVAGGESAVPQNTMANTGAAIKRNVARAQTPQAVTNIGRDLTSADTSLNKEASDYGSSYANQNYAVPTEDIDAAVQGSPDAVSRVSNRFNQKSYGDVKAFAPQTNYNVPDAAMLGTEGGIKNLMARESGGRYSPGEGAFDVGLLKRNTDFNLISDQLQKQQRGLVTKAADLKNTATADAQRVANEKYAAATGQLEGTLQTRAGEVLAPAKTLAETTNKTRGALRKAPDQAFIDAQKASALELAGQDFGLNQNPAAAFLGQTGLDANRYYDVAGDVGYRDVLNEDQVGQFNRIQKILGTGQGETVGAGVGADQRFNVEGYRKDATAKALGLKTKDDERITAEAAAKAQADTIASQQAAEAKAQAEAQAQAQADAVAAAEKAKQDEVQRVLAEQNQQGQDYATNFGYQDRPFRPLVEGLSMGNKLTSESIAKGEERLRKGKFF